MLSLFDWENTKLPRSENKTGLPFAWVKISVLKKLRGIYFSAMRVARGCGSGYIRYLRNERLWGKENSKRISGLLNIKRHIERKVFVKQAKVLRGVEFK